MSSSPSTSPRCFSAYFSPIQYRTASPEIPEDAYIDSPPDSFFDESHLDPSEFDEFEDRPNTANSALAVLNLSVGDTNDTSKYPQNNPITLCSPPNLIEGHQQELPPGISSHQSHVECGTRSRSRKPDIPVMAGKQITENLPRQLILYESDYPFVNDGSPFDTSMDEYLKKDISPNTPGSSSIIEDLCKNPPSNPEDIRLVEPPARKSGKAKKPPRSSGSGHHLDGDSKVTVPPESGQNLKPPDHIVVLGPKTPAAKPPDHQQAGPPATGSTATGPSGVNFHQVEKVQLTSSTKMTNFKLVQLYNLYGRHVVRNVSVGTHGGLKRKTHSTDEVFCRTFIDNFEEGMKLTPAFSPRNDRVDNKIDSFVEKPRESMRSLAKCQNVLVGIALHKYRSELGLDEENLSPKEKKKRNNRFTTVQRTDRPASKTFLDKFCLKYGVNGDTPLEELEQATQSAVLFLDSNGCISSISPNIIKKDYCIVTILQGEDQMYLGKLKGICREDKKRETIST